MPGARGHEVPWDGGEDGGEKEQSLCSPSREQQRVPRSETGLVSKVHLGSTEEKQERAFFSTIEQLTNT